MSSAIHVEDLSVRFGSKQVLDDISFCVDQGQIAALIGPNGSGKTTLLKTLLGLVPMHTGEVLFFDRPLNAFREKIGYVPQRFEFQDDFPITVTEFMNLAVAQQLDEKAIVGKLDEVGLPASATSSLLGTLSGGQLQRVLIAQALLNEPELLLLDEPSTGIDIVGEAEFYNILKNLNKQRGTTILLVSHDVSMVSKLVDQVICINKCLLCAGPPQTMLTQQKLTELYGKHAAVHNQQKHKH